MRKLFIVNHLSLALALSLFLAVSCGERKMEDAASVARPGDLIPLPVEFTLGKGSIASEELGEPVIRISEKALSKRLHGRRLADWQRKSAYWLEVGKKGVRIEAADEEGVFYALQSLKMLSGLDEAVSYCTILDWPRFRHRGIMLDVSRHFQDKDFVMKQLEMMARLKMNRFHFHLVDNPGWRLQIDAYPRLTQLTAWRPEACFWNWEKNEIGGPFVEEGTPGAYGGYYTKQDIVDILSFAADWHIEVIPEIEMPGHNYETRAAYPELACSLPPAERPDEWELCPGKESTFEFLEKVLLEVFELFPSEYIHIGGDEAGKRNWERCPDCQARMKAEGLESVEELQSYLIKRIERFVQEHGKRIIGWDEILEGGLAPDATVMSWRGTEGGIKAIGEGHDVIFSPTHYYYLDYHQGPQYRAIGRYLPLEKVYSFDPMEERIDEADADHVLGVQGNLWTEQVYEAWHAEMQLYPRAFAIAETGWSPAWKKDFRDFKRRSAAWGRVARDLGYTLYTPPGEWIPATGASDFSSEGLVQEGRYRYISFTDSGQWTGYRFLGFSTSPHSLTLCIQSGMQGAELEVRSGAPDGPLVCRASLPDTGWKWKEITLPVQDSVLENESLYLVAARPAFSVRSFRFSQ